MSRKIGFWSVLALVMGSQIGSGVFMLPATLAPFGLYSLAGWAVGGLGAILLALVFAKLCEYYPRTGGPHAYVQEAFGPHAAFFTGWTYWIISWVSTTAVITASVGYLSPLFDIQSSGIHLALEIALLVIITYINCRGVKTAGQAEFWLSLLKVIPLFVVPFCALFYFNRDNFTPVAIHSASESLTIIGRVTLIALWGFIGLESATTPAGSVENPSKTIPRAVILGTSLVALLYVMNSAGIMGAVPGETLMASKAPYADATQTLFGGQWHLIISAIAAIVCIGTLNAWTLASGQIALGLAQDNLLPKFFGYQNDKDAPVVALLISCFGLIPILFLTLNKDLAHQINLIIDFSVVAFLFIYAICCLSLLKIMIVEKQRRSFFSILFSLLALGFCIGIIASTPLKTLLVASLFVLSGVPIYLYRSVKVHALK